MILRKLGITILLFLLFASPVRADSVTVGGISKEFICQCGCNMVLSNCTHVECHSREAMTALITQQIDQGQSGEQIKQLFVAQYGEQVLATPPKKGFNLVAWGLPFAALLFGGGLISFAIKEWVRRGKDSQTSTVHEVEEGDEEYRRRLDKELGEFTGRGFR